MECNGFNMLRVLEDGRMEITISVRVSRAAGKKCLLDALSLARTALTNPANYQVTADDTTISLYEMDGRRDVTYTERVHDE